MLDFDTAIELMKKYGYSSTSTHPYIYQKGDTLGLCYAYYDEEYGPLERIKILDDFESFEMFLKQLAWVNKNGQKAHVRMILDNYEAINPKVIFLRNEKIMVEGEMFNIEDFDLRESQRLNLDEISKLIYEAGDLLLVYDEVKGRQLQYLKNIVSLKNTLRTNYFELQKEIDHYNRYKVERHLTLLPDVNDVGINDTMEIALKDKYNLYIQQRPSVEEAADFLKEVWELNKNLELNIKYYQAMKEETDTRNEMKVVEEKMALMKKLNEDGRSIFGVDLVGRFRKINKKHSLTSVSMSDDIIQNNVERINRKYSVYDSLNPIYTSDYLRESTQNTNYGDLVIKYSKSAKYEDIIKSRKAANEVAANLSIQYRDKLTPAEQAALIIFNNHKYRKLCMEILNVEGFEQLPAKKLISKINSMKDFSKIKTECFDIVKKRINDPINAALKEQLFRDYDFTTFETFIQSLVQQILLILAINNKMILSGDINMYSTVKKVEDIQSKKSLLVTNDLSTLLNNTKTSKELISIALLKEFTPVLYSPYYFDIGDIYSKDASYQMYVKEMINFEMLIDIHDIIINIDPVKTNVVRYYSEPLVIDNYSVVDDIKMNYSTTFCKFAITNGLGQVPVSTNVEVTPQALEGVPVPETSAQASFTEEVLEEQQAVQPVTNTPENVTVPVVDNNQVQNNIGQAVVPGIPVAPTPAPAVELANPFVEESEVTPQQVSDKKEQVAAEDVKNNVESSTEIKKTEAVVDQKEQQPSVAVSESQQPLAVEKKEEANVKPVIQENNKIEVNVQQTVSKPVENKVVSNKVLESQTVKPVASVSEEKKPITGQPSNTGVNKAVAVQKPTVNVASQKPVTQPPVLQGAKPVSNNSQSSTATKVTTPATKPVQPVPSASKAPTVQQNKEPVKQNVVSAPAKPVVNSAKPEGAKPVGENKPVVNNKVDNDKK